MKASVKQPVFLISTLCLLLSGCGDKESDSEIIKSIKYLEISKSNQVRTRQLSGVVKSAEESDLSFRVAGQVKAINVNEGDFVEKDQILSTLDQKDYKINIEEVSAGLSRSRAILKEKQEFVKRKKALLEKGYSTLEVVQKAEADYQSAIQDVEIGETKLEDAQIQLERTDLKAPFAGKISKRAIDPFKEVRPGQLIFQLQSKDGLEVEVMMPETLIREVSQGDRIVVTFPTLKNVKVSGQVSEIGTEAEKGNAYKVTAELRETQADLRPGMTANVLFNLGDVKGKNIFLIPLTSIDLRYFDKKLGSLNEQVAIYVFNKGSSKIKMRRIKTREVRGNKVEVIKGLKEGDIIVTAGVAFLSDGQKVKLWKPKYTLPATLDK